MRYSAAVVTLIYTLSAIAQKLPRNPIRVKSSEFLGNVTSTNSDWGRVSAQLLRNEIPLEVMAEVS